MDISEEEKTNARAHSDLRSTKDQESSPRIINSHTERSKHGCDGQYRRLTHSSFPNGSFADKSIPRLVVIVSINEQFRAAVVFKSYRIIDNLQRYHEDVALEIHRMRNI